MVQSAFPGGHCGGQSQAVILTRDAQWPGTSADVSTG